MSKNYALKADARDRAGKGVARALRRDHKVPAVIYGAGKEPVTIALPAKEVNLEYNKGHMFTSLCELDLNGEKHLVLARDVQLHVVKDTVDHIDFLRVSSKTKIAVKVPVHFINEEECLGLKEKGNLNIIRHEVELVCQATEIPEHIEVDLTPFSIGDAVRISHAVMPKGSKPVIDDRDFNLAIIAAPRVLEIIEEAGAAEGGEEKAAEGEEKPKAE